MFRKGVYHYECIDNQQRFNETLLDKKEFYNNITIEDITDEDYKQARIVQRDFELKNIGDYYDLYFQRDTLSLVNTSENFRNKCIEIYELDPATVLSQPK